MPSRFTSNVTLYHVDEIGNGRYPAFSTIAKQGQFFTARKKHEIPNCKMIRGKGSVRVNVPTKSFYKDINYLSYKNPDYDNKTMYAFVTSYTYINNQCTELTFAIDFIQSFMFDVQCVGENTIIERQHLSNARKQLAAANPYNPDLWELETNEALPVGTNFEERGYAVEHYTSLVDPPDGFAYNLFCEETQSPDEYVFLAYISNIDFHGLDDIADEAGTTKPSSIWKEYLDNQCIFAIDFDGTYHGTMTNPSVSSITGRYSEFPNVTAIICGNQEMFTGSGQWGSTAGHTNGLFDELTGWNCISAVVNVVCIPIWLVYYMFSYSTSTEPLKPVELAPLELDVENEKLYRFPFSYVRIITPDGNIKELRYEYFQDIADAQTLSAAVGAMGLGCDITNGVSMFALPKKYRIDFAGDDYDANDKIVYNQFPTAPYNIDASVTTMAALAAERSRSDTLVSAKAWATNNYTMDSMNSEGYRKLEAAGAMLGGASSVGGSITVDKLPNYRQINVDGGNILNVPGMMKNMADTAIAQTVRDMTLDTNKTDAEITGNAAAYLVGDRDGIFALNYNRTDATYAVDQYHAPSGGGFENYTPYGWLNMALVHVKLRDIILEQYDKYFDEYGYTFGTPGVPYIFGYMGRSGVDAPSWTQNDDTYVKTTSACFKGTFQYVCELWAQAFNNGIHWLKGDDLI